MSAAACRPAFYPTEQEERQSARFTREYLCSQADASLKRLNTEYLDLYLLHQPDEGTPAAAIAAAMTALVETRKVRYWGMSNHSAAQVAEYAALGAPLAPIAGIEDYYNIAGEFLDKEGRSRVGVLEQEMFPLLRRAGLGLMAFSPMDTGRLSPSYVPPPDSPLAALTEVLDAVACDLGATRTQVCVAWVLTRPAVTCVLAGAESPEQVEENAAGAALALPSPAVAALEIARQVYRRRQAEERRSAS